MDFAYGNYSVLCANIGVLTASSFILTVGHLRRSFGCYVVTGILALIFLGNQVDELFSVTSLASSEELSLTLICLYTHLSHLVLSLFLFVRAYFRSVELISDVFSVFVSAYWHLVEVVWILILVSLIGF